MRSHRKLFLLLPAAVVAATVFVATTFASTHAQTLHGKVGPDFTISLTGDDGQPVLHLDPGQYTIEVDDEATVHNFHLLGPGVDQSTSVAGTGTTTWTVMLQAGTYTFQCDPHASIMSGNFTVGTAAATTTTAAPTTSVTTTTTSAPPARPPLVVLNGRVGPGYSIGLYRAGKRVTTLRAGRYRFVVADRSASHDFVLERLTGHGLARTLTTVPFVGTKTVTVTLTRGRWKYYCKPHESTMFGYIRVT